ncbi:MAG: nitroreductase [Alphaproteobacteria bacterium]|nr:nitroreductase [Alphaproteobacteria bacterium]
MTVTDAVRQRISTRAFLHAPIDRADLSDLLDAAQRSPSGGNLQPWSTIAIAGAAKEAVIDLAARTLMADPMAVIQLDRPVYPDLKAVDPMYDTRRRRVGEMMYEAIGIPKEDRAGRLSWFASNYRFFGAPVGLFFIIDTRMGHGQWAHMGMYMQTIALLAEERGWGTCMQECWARIRTELHDHFGLDQHHMVYSGMSLGVPDRSAPVNALYAERAPQDEVVAFRGF